METVSPRRLITEEHPRSVLVVRTDSTSVLIANPLIRSDSIIGFVRLQSSLRQGPLRDLPVTVALSDVASAAVQTVDTRKTLRLFIPAGVGLGILILLAT